MPKTTSDSNAWIQYFGRNPNAEVRLFCFPYVGGGPSVFREWHKSAPPKVEVCPVLMPGRERRMTETPFNQMGSLVDRLAETLPLDKPFVFFGHSMGALISFELTRELRRRGARLPSHLIVSACRAPQIRTQAIARDQLSDEAFLQELNRLGGTPKEVINEPELLELLMPVLRADFALVDNYECPFDEPLSCPISVFGGEDDVEVTLEHLQGWAQWTKFPSRRRIFPGGHFYLHEGRQSLQQEIAQLMA